MQDQTSFKLLGDGGLAVDLFYVLSGFVVAHGLGAAWRRAGGVKDFMAARLRRLYPLYALGMVLGAIAFAVLHGADARSYRPGGDGPLVPAHEAAGHAGGDLQLSAQPAGLVTGVRVRRERSLCSGGAPAHDPGPNAVCVLGAVATAVPQPARRLCGRRVSNRDLSHRLRPGAVWISMRRPAPPPACWSEIGGAERVRPAVLIAVFAVLTWLPQRFVWINLFEVLAVVPPRRHGLPGGGAVP